MTHSVVGKSCIALACSTLLGVSSSALEPLNRGACQRQLKLSPTFYIKAMKSIYFRLRFPKLALSLQAQTISEL